MLRAIDLSLGVVGMFVLAAVGCSIPGQDSTAEPAGVDLFVPPLTNVSGDGAAPAATLPCDIQQILANNCTTCHSDPPTAAPIPLVTLAELTTMSAIYPGMTVAQRALARMQDAAQRMPPPPNPPVSSQDIAAFSAWVMAGAQAGPSCAAEDAGTGDGGGGQDGGIGADLRTPPGDAAMSDLSSPAVCTSGIYWTGTKGSPLMHPGRACITCHAANNGPTLSIAGTVYPTAHEPDDCESTNGPVVTITDAKGAVLMVTANADGNFQTKTAVALPYHATVTYQGRTRSMGQSQTSGDCNGCHTQDGANGAPGRILQP